MASLESRFNIDNILSLNTFKSFVWGLFYVPIIKFMLRMVAASDGGGSGGDGDDDQWQC